ncbi:MAG: peptidyl-prolyl cis-trans isomerase cyclophilin type [Gemmatimonadetes bacterium]|nr:peptidyl-prolyl cis-trans isomerase cyclophilin type [Gemmatimonadota bacterium]
MVMRNTRRSMLIVLAAALSAAGCHRGKPLLAPSARSLAERAPDTVRVRFETSRGGFTVESIREWSPLGADRFYYLVRHNYYDGTRFFRVLPGFVAQFGISGDTAVSRAWDKLVIKDDSVRVPNTRGTITFATGGPNTRTTQLFINYSDGNTRLDRLGFSPFGRVTDGMAVADSLFSYGEGPPRGKGPDQDRIEKEGNAYLVRDYPKMDYVISARVIK